jgi:hypothetical protein
MWKAYSFIVAPLGQDNRMEEALELAKLVLESANAFKNDPDIIARTYLGIAVTYLC